MAKVKEYLLKQWSMNVTRLLILCLVSFFCAGCGSWQTPLETSKTDKDVINVGIDNSYPPMGFRDNNNQLIGFDVDLAKCIAEKLHREVVFHPMDVQTGLKSLQSGKIDLFCGNLSVDAAKKAGVMASKPYLKNSPVVLVLKDRNWHDIIALRGKKVALVASAVSSELEKELQNDEQLKGVQFKIYPSMKEAMESLQKKQISGIICSATMGGYYFHQDEKQLSLLAIAAGKPAYLGVGISAKDSALSGQVEKVLSDLRTDGTISNLSRKYFAKDISI